MPCCCPRLRQRKPTFLPPGRLGPSFDCPLGERKPESRRGPSTRSAGCRAERNGRRELRRWERWPKLRQTFASDGRAAFAMEENMREYTPESITDAVLE